MTVPKMTERQRAKAAVARGYPSKPDMRSVSIATDATMARRDEARRRIRELVVEQGGEVEPWEGDDLGRA